MQIQQLSQERSPVCIHIVNPLESYGGPCKSDKQNDPQYYNLHCCLDFKSCSVYILREKIKKVRGNK